MTVDEFEKQAALLPVSFNIENKNRCRARFDDMPGSVFIAKFPQRSKNKKISLSLQCFSAIRA